MFNTACDSPWLAWHSLFQQDCRQIRSLAAGSSSSVKLSRFFDKVIERRYYSSREALSPDKRRPPMYTSSLYPKFYHNDWVCREYCTRSSRGKSYFVLYKMINLCDAKCHRIVRIKYCKAVNLAFLIHIPNLLTEIFCQICSKESGRDNCVRTQRK